MLLKMLIHWSVWGGLKGSIRAPPRIFGSKSGTCLCRPKRRGTAGDGETQAFSLVIESVGGDCRSGGAMRPQWGVPGESLRSRWGGYP